MSFSKFAPGVVTVALVAIAMSASADVHQETMRVELPIGERDTRANVKANALEEMKVRAARQAGSVVQAVTRVTGERYSEEIKTIGISLIAFQDVQDHIEVTPEGGARLVVTAQVSVDESELQRRATEIRSDSAKLEQIRVLTSENERLRRVLKESRDQLPNTKSSRQAAVILEKQVDLLDQLSTNLDKVGATFTPGALLDLAQTDAEQWGKIKAELDSEIFEETMNAPVHVRIGGVQADGADSYLARVDLGWDVDPARFIPILTRYFVNASVHDAKMGIKEINLRWFPNQDRVKTPFTQRVYEYLAKNSLQVEIRLGDSVSAYPVVFYGNAFFDDQNCEHSGAELRQDYGRLTGGMCFISVSPGGLYIFGLRGNSISNPVAIRLTSKQAAQASKVTASWVWINAGKEVKRRTAELF